MSHRPAVTFSLPVDVWRLIVSGLTYHESAAVELLEKSALFASRDRTLLRLSLDTQQALYPAAVAATLARCMPRHPKASDALALHSHRHVRPR